jgi:hypothetical protein
LWSRSTGDDRFAEAVRRKLLLEIAGASAPADSHTRMRHRTNG